jgi:CDP-glucose 4,6-dehydratase
MDMTNRNGHEPGDFWRGRRAFVTGATGFVGSWLVKELLAEGARVTVLVKDWDPQSELLRSGASDQVAVVNGDLQDFATLEHAFNLHEPDTVFHLGAQTQVTVAYRSPLATFETNVRGTYNLLEACRQHGDLVRRIVVASTDKAYGAQPVLPYTEDAPLLGLHNPYDASKVCTDLLCQTYINAYDLPLAITRFGNVYGGGDRNWARIIPGAIRSALRDESLVLRSDGTYTRDYIYVRDVAQAYMLLARRLDEAAIRGQAFNFSTEQQISVLDLVAEVHDLMEGPHRELDIRNTVQAEIKDQHLSAAKARALLGWSPRYSLREGLQEAITWYENFFDSPAPANA